MAKKNVAVYDDSEGYIQRFLEYVNSRGIAWLEVNGFTKTKALKEYLETNRVDLLLFSLETSVEEKGDREEEFEFFSNHANVREFVYFGERRNSRSQVRHINKYRSMEEILSGIQLVLFGEQEDKAALLPDEGGAELVGMYDVYPSSISIRKAIEIAEGLAETQEVLLVDLERCSILSSLTGTNPDSSISDLIFFYKTNPARLKESLMKKKKRHNEIDILSSPEDPEDLEEIPEKEWPAFLKKIGALGGYDVVVVHMGEAFRSLIWMFEACSRIYMPDDGDPFRSAKMKVLSDFFANRGRKDLWKKIWGIVDCDSGDVILPIVYEMNEDWI